MMTPDQVRLRLEQTRVSGDPWQAMALLEELLPELVALAQKHARNTVEDSENTRGTLRERESSHKGHVSCPAVTQLRAEGEALFATFCDGSVKRVTVDIEDA